MAVRTDANEILDATAACIARFGLGKTTLDDVAKAAGCSRATVYRLFPGKQQLLGAYVAVRRAPWAFTSCTSRPPRPSSAKPRRW